MTSFSVGPAIQFDKISIWRGLFTEHFNGETDSSHDANFVVTTTASFATSDVSILFLISFIITVTSQCAPWRLRSPGSQLFAQPLVQAHIKENIKALRHWPLWGESTGDRPVDSPHKGPCSDAKIVSIWWRHHDNYNLFGFLWYRSGPYLIPCVADNDEILFLCYL